MHTFTHKVTHLDVHTAIIIRTNCFIPIRFKDQLQASTSVSMMVPLKSLPLMQLHLQMSHIHLQQLTIPSHSAQHTVLPLVERTTSGWMKVCIICGKVCVNCVVSYTCCCLSVYVGVAVESTYCGLESVAVTDSSFWSVTVGEFIARPMYTNQASNKMQLQLYVSVGWQDLSTLGVMILREE